MAIADQRKVAFVTGASSGIGRATAEAFVRRGYATALVDRDEEAGRGAAEELGNSGECLFIRCEMTDDEGVRQAVEQTVAHYGRLDAAFNGAGISGEFGDTTSCSMENWNNVIAVNLTGVFSCMRYQIPAMLKSGGGSIVNCSAVAGLVGAPYLPAYVASKHAISGLTKTTALEYARQNIRVNAVAPGMIDTPMTRNSMSEEVTAALIAETPVGRFAEASEIADTVVWLCDGSPGYLTGHILTVDGGWTSR